MHRLATDGITVVFDPVGGIIDEVTILCEGGQTLRPLHKAIWAKNQEPLPQAVPTIEKRLAGDFFCAPFAKTGAHVPLHGWAANGDWQQVAKPSDTSGVQTYCYRLRQEIEGAVLTKKLTIRPSHAFVYQVHTFTGGSGTIPIAHHAMLHVPGGAQLSFSPKIAGSTGPVAPEGQVERGRSILAYPQTFARLSAVRLADGSVADASSYPFQQDHEDVVVLSEQPGNTIGWSAAVAANQGFIFIALKDADALPQTVLWMSNGGRYYMPWNGRHTAVIGIEEAAVDFHLTDEEAQAHGGRLDLSPGSESAIRYAFGALPVPDGWSRVTDVTLSGDSLTISDVGGGTRTMAFDGAFFSAA